VLRHRLILNFAAQSEGIKPDDVVDKLLASIPPDQPHAHGKTARTRTPVS
jgi:MoxR-like ATPase